MYNYGGPRTEQPCYNSTWLIGSCIPAFRLDRSMLILSTFITRSFNTEDNILTEISQRLSHLTFTMYSLHYTLHFTNMQAIVAYIQVCIYRNIYADISNSIRHGIYMYRQYIVGPGGALVETTPFDRKVVGSNPAL